MAWHIINSPCKPVLAVQVAKQLGIIKFEGTPDVFHPEQMIQSDDKSALQDILQRFPQNSTGLGKKEVMEAISTAGITLNPSKYTFGASEIEFWGLRIGPVGVTPSPDKVDALNYISPPS